MRFEWQLAFAVASTFAIYRITNLLVVDKVSEPARKAVIARLGRRPSRFRIWLTDLITCVFCVAVWVSGVLVVAAYLSGILIWMGWRAGWFWAGLWWMALAGFEQAARAGIDFARGIGNATEAWTEQLEDEQS